MLGTSGFMLVFKEMSVSTALFTAVQLFLLNAGGSIDGSVPWQLEVARWLAPLLSGTFAAGAALALASNARDQLTARFLLHDHTIIVGLGRKGLNLALDLRRANRRVVGVDQDLEMVRAARQAGLVALSGDGFQSNVLANAGLKRASRVVFLTAHGEANVIGAMETTDLHGGIPCHAHIPSIEQRNLLYRQNIFGDRKTQIFMFNYYERLARLSLARYPVEALAIDPTIPLHSSLGLLGVESCTKEPPQVFIRLSKDFSEAVCAEIAKTVHLPFTGGRTWNKACVTIVGPHAKEWESSVLHLYPRIREIIDLKVLEPSNRESTAQTIVRALAKIPISSPVTVFLELDDASRSFCEALEIVDMVLPHSKDSQHPLRCIFDFSESPAIQRVVAADSRLSRSILSLPSFSECCGARSLFDDHRDTLARLVHERYGGSPAWEQLTSELQESNRAVADHIPVILRATGRSPEEVMHPSFRWPDEELEALAEAEHRRWSAQKWLDGWQPDLSLGEGQDKRSKHHGCLGRDYSGLSERMKELDRENIRIIGELLLKLGKHFSL